MLSDLCADPVEKRFGDVGYFQLAMSKLAGERNVRWGNVTKP